MVESMPLMIAGEVGVGKLALAEAIAADRERVTIDAARHTANDAQIKTEVAGALERAGRAVIIRRVHCISEQTVRWLADVAASAEHDGSRIIVTRTAVEPGRPVDGFGMQILVPPLRERLEDILDLVPDFISRYGGTGRMTSAALQALTRYDWPGNARELDALVRRLLTSRRTADITLADLPAGYQPSGRRLRRMEQIERTAIIQALAEGKGNKSKAAELLEIGRATLYRKMSAYGLDLELTTI
jgi:DNA-binding NtrC family response regulator